MENSFFISALFERVVKDFLEDYQLEQNPNYLLKGNLDYEHFVRNRCPDWVSELDLLDFQIERYFDKSAINHLFNLACFQFFKESLHDKGVL